MKKTSMVFVQLLVVALGIFVAGALLWEPTVEGVNANAASLSDIYFDDPFLAYIYFSFTAVFIGLYQAFKLAGYLGKGEGISEQSLKALRTIKYCALVFAAFIVGAEAMITINRSASDDIAGGVAMGLFMIVISIVVASVAWMLEKNLEKRSHAA